MNKKIIICVLAIIIIIGIIIGIILSNNDKTNTTNSEVDIYTEVNELLHNEEAFKQRTDDAVERAKQILNE